MKLMLLAAAAVTFATATPSLAASTHPVRRGGVALDPQTIASITHGPDMITRAGSSQKAARAELDSGHPALADTVTAKRWSELRDR